VGLARPVDFFHERQAVVALIVLVVQVVCDQYVNFSPSSPIFLKAFSDLKLAIAEIPGGHVVKTGKRRQYEKKASIYPERVGFRLHGD
jgi:hypothetical protein